MTPEQRRQHQQNASRMTIFCLISLVIGAYIIWANKTQGVVDSASVFFPLVVILVVHLLGGAIAIFHTVKTRNFIKNIHVYGYFSAVIILAFRLISSRWLLF